MPKHALLQIPDCCTYMNADLLEQAVLMMLNKELMLRGNAMKQNESLSSFQRAGIQSLKRNWRNADRNKSRFGQKRIICMNSML